MLPYVQPRSDGQIVITAERLHDGAVQIIFLSRIDAEDVRDRLNYLLPPNPKRAA
jgi:hypothetical protein